MISPKARPVMSDHFGTPDKPLLYQSYLLASLVHQTSPSCTKYSHTVSLGLFIILIQHRKETVAESLLLATISYSEIRNYLVIFMLPT